MKNALGEWRSMRHRKGTCLRESDGESSEENKQANEAVENAEEEPAFGGGGGKTGGANRMAADRGVPGASIRSSAEVGIGRDAGSTSGTICNDHAGRAERMARAGIGETGACGHRGNRSGSGVEARPVFHSGRKGNEG